MAVEEVVNKALQSSPQVKAAMISSIVAAAGIIINLIITIVKLFLDSKQYKRTLSAQYKTDKRMDWIYALRDTVSEFISHLCTPEEAEELDSRETTQQILSRCRYKIELLLNYKGVLDREILNIIEDIVRLISNSYCADKTYNLEDLVNGLIALMQIYLKFEWNRVKDEVEGKAEYSEKEALEKYKDLCKYMIANSEQDSHTEFVNKALKQIESEIEKC